MGQMIDQQGGPSLGPGVEVILGCLNLLIERWTGVGADRAGRYRPTGRTIFDQLRPHAPASQTSACLFQDPATPCGVERLVARFFVNPHPARPRTAVILFVLDPCDRSPLVAPCVRRVGPQTREQRRAIPMRACGGFFLMWFPPPLPEQQQQQHIIASPHQAEDLLFRFSGWGGEGRVLATSADVFAAVIQRCADKVLRW